MFRSYVIFSSRSLKIGEIDLRLLYVELCLLARSTLMWHLYIFSLSPFLAVEVNCSFMDSFDVKRPLSPSLSLTHTEHSIIALKVAFMRGGPS